MFSSQRNTWVTLRIAKSLAVLHEIEGTALAASNDPLDLAYGSFYFYGAIRDLVRDKDRFSEVMNQQNYAMYCDFLFFASKMKSLEIGGRDSIIRDIFCQKLSELQERGKLANFIPMTIESMLSLQMATKSAAPAGKKEKTEFW